MLGPLGAAVLVAVILYLALRWFASARPGDVAHALRTFAAVFSALASTGLIVAGRLGLALITVAATVMAVRALLAARRGPTSLGDSAPADEAVVETDLLSMRLDRGTGRIDGTVRRGAQAGRRLDRLGLPALLDLLAQARRDDPPSADLLEAYLDRREPAWRRTGEGAASSPAGSSAMDEAEALEVLGLPRGATPGEIKAAHRRLMAKVHPDHGGSTYLASQINRAKEFLLAAAAGGDRGRR